MTGVFKFAVGVLALLGISLILWFIFFLPALVTWILLRI